MILKQQEQFLSLHSDCVARVVAVWVGELRCRKEPEEGAHLLTHPTPEGV